jgi:hypothetical protein
MKCHARLPQVTIETPSPIARETVALLPVSADMRLQQCSSHVHRRQYLLHFDRMSPTSTLQRHRWALRGSLAPRPWNLERQPRIALLC